MFLSHANPDDNAIAAWYGARLEAAGYTVWSDLTRLLGGEEMWLDIDNALRFHARKIVVLLSKASTDPNKEGVRAELDRAHALRKKLGDNRFVIPVKIDDAPFEDLPPTISNRTIIAAGNHADALARVLDILEKDGVRRSDGPSTDALQRWQTAFAPEQVTLEHAEDILVSNWHPIVRLPAELKFYEIGRPLKNIETEPAAIAKEHPLPMLGYMRRLVTFADWDEVQEPIADTTPVSLHHAMPIETFLAGGDERIRFAKGVPKKMLASLLRQAFDRMAAGRSLNAFALSDKKNAWWMPAGVLPGDKQSFVRASGTTGYRKLTGMYGLRERDWHFGITATPLTDEPLRLKFTPHVIYTDPTGIKEPTASYRRAHCKLWFNAKWRDLLYAMTAYLSDEKGEIVLPFGRDALGAVSARAVVASLSVRPSTVLERKARKVADTEGDAADLDVSDLMNDPAFARLDDEEPDEGEGNTDDDAEGDA
ncbi:toll/interleukin-1 receptor domain-containing protein [Terricaulis silvestris]|uniref:toll/interleukin-1 receptor domain-containing protein n=1 Tax=Terricaulis silvestris TaxID=2686094 RepID=UPI00131C9194|nr:toll/interleukin-1 receptor domain-containing protein [Terricaulis silvestris]